MFQTINEKVAVAGAYTQGSFVPKKIRWGNKVLVVQTVTLISEIRDGKVKKRMYSCLCGRQLYRVMFNRETEIWILEEVWVE